MASEAASDSLAPVPAPAPTPAGFESPVFALVAGLLCGAVFAVLFAACLYHSLSRGTEGTSKATLRFDGVTTKPEPEAETSPEPPKPANKILVRPPSPRDVPHPLSICENDSELHPSQQDCQPDISGEGRFESARQNEWWQTDAPETQTGHMGCWVPGQQEVWAHAESKWSHWNDTNGWSWQQTWQEQDDSGQRPVSGERPDHAQAKEAHAWHAVADAVAVVPSAPDFAAFDTRDILEADVRSLEQRHAALLAEVRSQAEQRQGVAGGLDDKLQVMSTSVSCFMPCRPGSASKVPPTMLVPGLPGRVVSPSDLGREGAFVADSVPRGTVGRVPPTPITLSSLDLPGAIAPHDSNFQGVARGPSTLTNPVGSAGHTQPFISEMPGRADVAMQEANWKGTSLEQDVQRDARSFESHIPLTKLAQKAMGRDTPSVLKDEDLGGQPTAIERTRAATNLYEQNQPAMGRTRAVTDVKLPMAQEEDLKSTISSPLPRQREASKRRIRPVVGSNGIVSYVLR